MSPLKDIEVFVIATLVASPDASASVAKVGADVIKIEKPRVGNTLKTSGNSRP